MPLELLLNYLDDCAFLARSRDYQVALLARWAATYARFWHERDHSMEHTNPNRLVSWSVGWWEEVPARFERYYSLTNAVL